jgi:histidinol phosphatase-like enzyme
MIGDKESDIQLAENAGIGHTIYIGGKKLPNATFSFPSVTACRKYFQENQDKILSKVADI